MQAQPSIIHNPYGIEHPYETSPVERQPHAPVAGEPTLLNAQTSPAGAIIALLLLLSINDAPPEPFAVDRLASNDNDSVTAWQVKLPPLASGNRVSYYFQDKQSGIVSETFSFIVAGWQQAGAVQTWRIVNEALQLQVEPNLTVTLQLAQPNQIEIRYELGAPMPLPHTNNPATKLLVSEEALHLCLQWNRVQIKIQRNPYRLLILGADGSTLFSEPGPGGMRWLVHDGEILKIAQAWQSAPEEHFFGFGERFNSFDQRGQQIDTLVYEEYKNQGKRTYLPVPFFISSKGYGLWLNTFHRAYFDLAYSHTDLAALTVDNHCLEATFFVGEPKEVVSAFTEKVGRALLPPRWAFGLWMSSNEWNSQSQVMDQVALTRLHEIPASVLVIEAWSDEATFYIFNDAEYQPRTDPANFSLSDFTFPAQGRWPNPKAMVDSLHREGIRLLLWQIPVFKKLDAPHPQHDLDVAEVLAKGLIVHEADGSPHRIRPLWFRGGFVPDFGNPELEDWWFARRRYLIDELGVDGFKTDGGEHLWGNGLRTRNGQQGSDLLNQFPYSYQKAYARFAGSERVLFSRAGYTGAQSFSTHWAGDENSTFAAFRASVTAGLTAGASGFTFWGWDIGGFGGGIPSAELYLRATAMATFCPIMQYHSEYNPERIECRDRTPWNVQAHTGNAEIIPIFRFFANLRMNLLPHIWSEAIKASRSGLPLMRALAFEFPDDSQAVAFPYQYLFGENLLIAPVVWEGCSESEVYLPKGEWYDFWTGQRYAGSTVLRCSTPINHIPVFVRAGSVVALNLPDSMILGQSVGNAVDQYQNLVFRTYPASTKAVFSWFNNPGELPQIFEIAPYSD